MRIRRDIYLNKLISKRHNGLIKVVTGVRRCGKSKLMDAFAEYLKTSDESANIIHINFNLTEFEDLLEYHALESYVEGNYDPSSEHSILWNDADIGIAWPLVPGIETKISPKDAKALRFKDACCF